MAKAMNLKEYQQHLKRYAKESGKMQIQTMNATATAINKKRLEIVNANMKFRTAGSRRHLLGRPLGGEGQLDNRGSFFLYLAKTDKNPNTATIMMGVRTKAGYMTKWELGGTISSDDQSADFTKAARGGNWRKLPKKHARMKKGVKLPSLSIRLSRRAWWAQMNKLRKSGMPFVAPSRTVNGRRKRGGVYVFERSKMVMLRGFDNKPIKIPAIGFQKNAVAQVMSGSTMQKIVQNALKELYQK
jgi:hypothetical protein